MPRPITEAANTPKDVNMFKATGRIDQIMRDSRGNTSFILTVIRNDHANPIQVLYNGILPADIRGQDHVTVEGYLVSYRSRDPRDPQRRRTTQYFQATRCERMKPEIEDVFGFKGSYYAPDRFDVYLSGTIVSKIDYSKPGRPSRYGKLVIHAEAPDGGRRPTDAIASFIKTSRRTGFESISEGDRCCVVCSVYCPEPKEGKPQRFEDLTIEDIKITARALKPKAEERDSKIAEAEKAKEPESLEEKRTEDVKPQAEAAEQKPLPPEFPETEKQDEKTKETEEQ